MAGTAGRMQELCCKLFSCVELQMEGLTSCFDKSSLVTMHKRTSLSSWLHYNQCSALCLFGLCDSSVTESLIMFGNVSVDALEKKTLQSTGLWANISHLHGCNLTASLHAQFWFIARIRFFVWLFGKSDYNVNQSQSWTDLHANNTSYNLEVIEASVLFICW